MSERRVAGGGGGAGNGRPSNSASFVTAGGGFEGMGMEAMPEGMREILVDSDGVDTVGGEGMIGDDASMALGAIIGSPERTINRGEGFGGLQQTPSTPGRFADAEDHYRSSQIPRSANGRPPANGLGIEDEVGKQDEEEEGDLNLLPPIPPFKGYDSPISRKSMSTIHGQSPSASSINSTMTNDPMSTVPFIIPSTDLTATPEHRRILSQRARINAARGSEGIDGEEVQSLSNYPGEAISFVEGNTSVYTPKSMAVSAEGFPYFPPDGSVLGGESRRYEETEMIGEGKTPVAVPSGNEKTGEGNQSDSNTS